MRPCAAVLAAGLSRRLGRPKQLLDWHGIPLVRHSVLTLLQAAAFEPSQVAVIVGHHAEAVRLAVQDLGVTIIANPAYASGQGSSVACAAQWAMTQAADALLVSLCDQPFLTGVHVDALWQRWCVDSPDVLIPRVADQPTNPVLWAQSTWSALAQLQGEQGGRAVIQQGLVKPTWCPMPDDDLLLDIDSEEDYQRLCAR
jgi:CTP:molybdopterin cytidylyltransferase MocA